MSRELGAGGRVSGCGTIVSQIREMTRRFVFGSADVAQGEADARQETAACSFQRVGARFQCLQRANNDHERGRNVSHD